MLRVAPLPNGSSVAEATCSNRLEITIKSIKTVEERIWTLMAPAMAWEGTETFAATAPSLIADLQVQLEIVLGIVHFQLDNPSLLNSTLRTANVSLADSFPLSKAGMLLARVLARVLVLGRGGFKQVVRGGPDVHCMKDP